MQKIRLGKTELKVSRVGFGGIPIQRLNENESVDVVRYALNCGINFIDTANAYTTSEERYPFNLTVMQTLEENLSKFRNAKKSYLQDKT